MSELMAAWRAKKAQEEADLHERLRAAVLTRQVEIYTDQRMLDFQGSPVHNSWDHIVPLMALMLLALAILLATGVAIGIVAMTIGALIHLLGIKYFIAWRIRARTTLYVLQSAAHWNQIWTMGGMAILFRGGAEPPCYAPRGDWRKFVRRTLYDFAHPAPPEVPEGDPEPEILPP
ncbi:conserved hypothetical protein [Magnetospirillum sp. LM-5]|uniref:hypothetical protein n=1 Tax=Magnetospirillum sp. LM-5 TaxID=2681466 RepID=UPI00137D9504|nr:hypothetical protein [Magnetospirillum sp. LM-5]CAA7617527.1 conserved hypothetical protein [Magnetospirillum sp. LM-5]